MKKIILLITIASSSLLFSLYNVGQTVSLSDQNIDIGVCNGQNPETGSTGDFSLADLNGDLNGGNYYVFHIDMAASW